MRAKIGQAALGPSSVTASTATGQDFDAAVKAAQSAEDRAEWDTAIKAWSSVRACFPNRTEGYDGGIRCLSATQRTAECDTLYGDANRQFPEIARYAIDFAWLAHHRKDWSAAVDRWRSVTARFPGHGDLGEAASLSAAGRWAEADQVLEVAIVQDPSHQGYRVAYAHQAQQRGDLNRAIDRWQTVRDLFPEERHAYLFAAWCLRDTGRVQEGEVLLATALEIIPYDKAIAVEFARWGTSAQSWKEAFARWRLVTERFSDDPSGFLEAVKCLESAGDLDEADTLLDETRKRFPENTQIATAYAQVAERRQDWAAAITRWTALSAQSPDDPSVYRGLATALRNLGQTAEAKTVLENAATRLSNDAVYTDLAREAEAQGDWPEAERCWQRCITINPLSLQSHNGLAEALRRQDRQDEADAAIVRATTYMPNEGSLVHTLARRCEEKGDWAKTEHYWRRFIELNAGIGWAYVGLALAVRRQDREREADAIVSRARELLPNDGTILEELIRQRREQADLPALLELSTEAAVKLPHLAFGHVNRVHCLRLMNRLEEAEAVAMTLQAQFPEQPIGHLEQAQIAMDAGRHEEAGKLWLAVSTRFPDDPYVRHHVFQAELTLAEHGIALGPVAAAPTGSREIDPRELMLHFESFGGTSNGCEFGLVQRAFNAEPLGLLRWAFIHPDTLAFAIRSEFDGVGLPENTKIIGEFGREGDYVTTDSRFYMQTHTFIPQSQVLTDDVKQKIYNRQQFLAREMRDEIAACEKIFVYKNAQRKLMPEELSEIVTAMRVYGDSWLLYVTVQEAGKPDGHVEVSIPGLMIGYISHFNNDTTNIATDSWLRICRNAFALWQTLK